MLKLCVAKHMDIQGITPAELARRASIAPLTARTLYRGDVDRIDLATMGKVANALGVKGKDLLEEVEEIPGHNTTPVAA